ncbi:hypothetical protein CPB83DRAFT_892054 [Crepidotus variabilis]|uniref:Uncharacterized protein n=1 Tax=Crepidotus variabilis TaxID=179855 RepID=A0A9P6JSW5_9AGAR|nr:hypothetical protein CPB83DRAFT_892054 [Crepidotus variabilis]
MDRSAHDLWFYTTVANVLFIAGGFQGDTNLAVLEESQPFTFKKRDLTITATPPKDKTMSDLTVKDTVTITVESKHAADVRAHCRTGAMYQTHKTPETPVKHTTC